MLNPGTNVSSVDESFKMTSRHISWSVWKFQEIDPNSWRIWIRQNSTRAIVLECSLLSASHVGVPGTKVQRLNRTAACLHDLTPAKGVTFLSFFRHTRFTFSFEGGENDAFKTSSQYKMLQWINNTCCWLLLQQVLLSLKHMLSENFLFPIGRGLSLPQWYAVKSNNLTLYQVNTWLDPRSSQVRPRGNSDKVKSTRQVLPWR
jgi:hypothetical protein